MRNQLIQRVTDRSWSWILRNVILPTGDAITHQGMVSRFQFLEQAQWWPEDRIREFQAQQLSKLMKTAYEVPFYKDLMDHAKVNWQDFKKPSDLRHLPLVTKDMMRSAYPARITRLTGLRQYETFTSGSTGSNFTVREDAATAGQYRAAVWLSLSWAGWELGEPHMQTGMTHRRTGIRGLKDTMLRCHYISAAALSDSDLDAHLERLERDKIQHLWGYPASLYVLAMRAAEKGWNLPLKSIVTWGDNLFPHYRDLISRVFQTRVFDTYGCAEGFQVAAQCGTGSHYHLHSCDVIAEFTDDQGKPVKAGERGHVIVTRLYPGPMPLIRYQVGDVAVPGPAGTCACGRGMPMMASIQGRDTDVVLTQSGNRLVVHFFTGVLEFFPEIRNFQIVQEEISSMTLRLVPSLPGALEESVQHRVVDALRKRGATGIEIKLEVVDEIPVASTGKRRFVISKLPKKERMYTAVSA